MNRKGEEKTNGYGRKGSLVLRDKLKEKKEKKTCGEGADSSRGK